MDDLFEAPVSFSVEFEDVIVVMFQRIHTMGNSKKRDVSLFTISVELILNVSTDGTCAFVCMG